MVVSPGQPPPNFNQQMPPGGFGGAPAQPTPPPKKGGAGKWIGLGCGCVFVIILVVGIVVWQMTSALSMGDEVTSADVALGQQFQATYTQSGSTEYQVWLDLDVNHPGGYSLTGPINISVAQQHVGQYQLAETGSGSPIQGRNTRFSRDWNDDSGTSTSGKLKLFSLPAYDDGATVTVWGTINGTPGMTATRLRVLVTE